MTTGVLDTTYFILDDSASHPTAGYVGLQLLLFSCFNVVLKLNVALSQVSAHKKLSPYHHRKLKMHRTQRSHLWQLPIRTISTAIRTILLNTG